MPDIAGRWIEATERRGIPAGDVLRAYMSAVTRRAAASRCATGTRQLTELPSDVHAGFRAADGPRLFARSSRAERRRCRLGVRAHVPDLRGHHRRARCSTSPIAGVTEMVSLSLVGVRVPAARARRAGRPAHARRDVPGAARASGARRSRAHWHVLFAPFRHRLLLALIAARRVAGFRDARWRTNEFAGVEGIFTIPVWPIKLLHRRRLRGRGARARAAAGRARAPLARDRGRCARAGSRRSSRLRSARARRGCCGAATSSRARSVSR